MQPADKQRLKALAHSLKPVVIIGQAGFTAAVAKEIDLALDTHELIKVRIRAEKTERQNIAGRIISETGADWVHSIGQICIFYRKNPKK